MRSNGPKKQSPSAEATARRTLAPQSAAQHLLDRVQAALARSQRLHAEALEMRAEAQRALLESARMQRQMGERLEELVRQDTRGRIRSPQLPRSGLPEHR